MPKSDVFANQFLALLLLNQDVLGVGDAGGLRGSATAGVLYASLHTADPTGGDQATSEVSYTGGYARLPVARSGAGFTLAGRIAQTAADLLFALCTAGGLQNVTHVGFGTSAAGAGKLLLVGALSPVVPVQAGIIPLVAAGTEIEET